MFVGQQESKDQIGAHYTCPAPDPMGHKSSVLEEVVEVGCLPRVYMNACIICLYMMEGGPSPAVTTVAVFPECGQDGQSLGPVIQELM